MKMSCPEDFYGVVSTCKQYLRPKNGGVAKKLILTIRAIMIGQQIDLVAGEHGDAATETTSVLSRKLLQTVRCQRHRALRHCGDPDRTLCATPITNTTSWRKKKDEDELEIKIEVEETCPRVSAECGKRFLCVSKESH